MCSQQKNDLPVAPMVFISYTWADELSALAIDQWLRGRGARVLIDRRDFLAGNDIEAEIVRCIQQAGKVICVYSANSANRPYPELERRITSALEKQDTKDPGQRRRLIYFCIDDTLLPTEALSRLAIKAAEMDFSSACEELWRNILGESASPVEIDISQFDEKPPWKMDKGEQEDVAKAAWNAMLRIIEGQTSGSTLDKWKREVFDELLENIDSLPEHRRLPRIISRLRDMIKKDEKWKMDVQESEAESQRYFGEMEGAKDSLAAKDAHALSSAILSGVMADNRNLHRIRRELLEDIETMEAEKAPYERVVQLMRKALLS